jgi:hypothetical protein
MVTDMPGCNARVNYSIFVGLMRSRSAGKWRCYCRTIGNEGWWLLNSRDNPVQMVVLVVVVVMVQW